MQAMTSPTVTTPSLNTKHSSGDLHSRLKSRKLLGVGETDDGDIHRSKLSQILGHSDQLYVRLPSGLRVWQFTLALVFTVIAVWALVFPQHLYETAFEAVEGQCLTLPVRFYGAALLSLSWLFWSTLHAIDRDVIKTALITSILYFFAHVLVIAFGLLKTLLVSQNYGTVIGSVFFALVSLHFYWSLSGCSGSARNSQNSNITSTGVECTSFGSPSSGTSRLFDSLPERKEIDKNK
ncbi:tumor protein p53-inducible protein 11 isoform X2 [Octopus bimaculoides]|uniref:Tumor protein p53-inducible protein 11 n=1 Tax=Octopus sinensis TaxID=2607531 RepID=A0A6P7SJ62_9MOLL|nr:tumor protein p53-inducible protein 11 isoform X2 [Octopus bimaculoides]XP_029638472.1 tumor protein p53-inducible protein 11 isoform X2 [Octopus sinensis]|eukprot:XP_014768124.1 PREDICTED: tumor protein p53-inducible protein 11-like isoform X3 [Octopus bimaculoides]